MASVYKTDFGINNFLISISNFNIPSFKKWTRYAGFKINQIHGKKRLFLDCGAFGIMRGTTNTTFYDYIDFVQRFGNTFDYIASMDVIGDPEATMNNYKDMLRISPHSDIIPTYHDKEPIEYFDKYCKMTDYVAIGGIAKISYTSNVIYSLIKKILDRKPKDVKLHVFGMGVYSVLKKVGHLIESIDNTNWLHGQKYSTMESRNGKKFHYYELLEKKWLTANQKKQLLGYNVRRLQELENDINTMPIPITH